MNSSDSDIDPAQVCKRVIFGKKVGSSKHSEINDVIFTVLYRCDQTSEG